MTRSISIHLKATLADLWFRIVISRAKAQGRISPRGKHKLAVLLAAQVFRVSASMVGRILRCLKDRGFQVEPVINQISVKKRTKARSYAEGKPKDYKVMT